MKLSDGSHHPYVQDYMNTFYRFYNQMPEHQRTEKMITDAYIAAHNQLQYPEYARIKFS